MVKLIQPSFAGGEVSVAVGARVDLAKRQVAVERAENFIPTFTGAMRSRPGQKFIARCKPTAGNHRIIEFEFNDTQTFVIELGHEYIRFHTQGAQVLDSSSVKTITNATQANPVVVTSASHGLSNGDEVYITGVAGMTELNGRSFLVASATTNTFALQDLNGDNVNGSGYTAYSSGGTATPPYEIASPYDEADLFELTYAQSGDILTICHPSYKPRELIRIANDSWTLSEIAFVPEQARPTNLSVDVNTGVTVGTITGVTQANPGVVTISSHGYSEGDRILILNVGGMTELNNFLYVVNNVLSANTFEIAYIGTTASIDTSGFTAYTSGGISRTAVRPRIYAVTAINEEDDEESLVALGARDITITNITQADPCVVTTAEGHGLEPYDDIVISGVGGMTELNGREFQTVFIDATSFSLQTPDGRDLDSTGLTAYTSGGVANPLFNRAVASAEADWDNTVAWTPAADARAYNVYATDNFGVFGFIGTTTKNRFEDLHIEPDYSSTPPRGYDPFDTLTNGANDQPGSVAFFEQRRVFANTNNNPNRFWMSHVGHYSNLTRSDPPLPGDGIVASIAGRKINEIKHMLPLSDLILFTGGGEYRLYSDSGIVSPSTINVRPQAYYGSTSVRPIVSGEVGLWLTPGQFIRSFVYSFQEAKFTGNDITLLARHLLDYNTIVDWDYAPSPYSTLFCVRDDGVGLYLTYRPESEVYAWSRATTAGKYKSTCVVRENGKDIHYFVVERTINGNTVKFLEREDEHQFSELSDAFCVDAGLTLDNPITITNMTAANPVVVTAAGHGLSNGDTVDINGVKEADASENLREKISSNYNGVGFTVANATANTFELQIEGVDYDGSGFAAYSSGGEAREAVTTVGGLWHLEGETVVAAGNGYSETGLTVSNGQITLTAAASRVHVGLGYKCQLITLPMSTYSSGRVTQGQAKNISRLTVQVERTLGMWYGPTTDQMREAKFGLPSQYAQPLAMVQDDIDVTMKPDWDKRKQIVIEQREPLPLTVLALIPDAQAGGN